MSVRVVQRAIRSSSQTHENDYYSLEDIHHETELQIHDERLSSALPYIIWTSKLQSHYWDLQLDANTIIGRLVSIL